MWIGADITCSSWSTSPGSWVRDGATPNFKARCLLTLQTDKPPSNTTTEIPRELAGISDTDFMIDSAEMFGLDDSCFGMDLLGFDFNL